MPKVIFEINSEKDKEWIKRSLKNKHRWKSSRLDIFQMTVREFPELLKLSTLPPSRWDNLIDPVIDSFYKKIKKELLKSKEKIESKWRKIEDKYFSVASELFDDHPWPGKNYKAILSVLKTFPRSLKRKEFHVPWRYKKVNYGNPQINEVCNLTPNYVIIHETLHFLFFDFWNKHFKGKLPQRVIWDFSEIINVIIQNKEPFFSYGDKVKAIPYPGHIRQYEVLDVLFCKSKSMKDFYKKAIIYLKKFEIVKHHQRKIKPRVVYTRPKNNAINVSPNIKTIVIRFNVKMYPYYWSIITNDKKVCHKHVYWINSKEIHIRVKRLKPKKRYEICLNEKFKSYDGGPLEPFTLKFTTGS